MTLMSTDTTAKATGWRRLLEPAAVLIMAAVLLGSVLVIAWRRHRLGGDVRVVKAQSAPFRVNVNRAGSEELMLLPGIGEVRAQRILAARQNGPFATLDEVRAASGLSEKQFQPLLDLIALEEPAQ